MKPNKIVGYFGMLAVFCYSTSLWALESDPSQPITIDSNTAAYDNVTATSTYTGNVVFVQVSILVNSDKLVVYFVDGDAEKLVFTGDKAKFKQMPNPGAEEIMGGTLTGEYFPKKNLLVLIEDAVIWQGTATYASDFIEYDSKRAIVKAGEKTSDAKRVHILLQPRKQAENKTAAKLTDTSSSKTPDQNHATSSPTT